MTDSNEKSFRKYLIVAIIVSFLIGGLSGAFFGIIGTSVIGPQFKDLLGLPATTNSSDNASTIKSVTVKEESATVDVVNKVSPAVVSIVATQDLSKIYQQNSLNPFNDFFGFGQPNQQPSGKQEVSSGTGFIISADGMILTNKHVVSIADAQYSVLTNDGNRYDATIVATDPLNDVAVLDIDAKNLSMVEFGNSDAVQIGQTVIAIGNSLGEYNNTVTKGVVSGIDRTITASGQNSSETLEGVIQTDASINPGNSGGPLLNLDSKVIGINTAIDSQGESIGFAIPINEVKTVVDSINKYGKIVRPILGVRYVLVTPALKEQNNLSVDYGALVIKGQSGELAVVPGSAADKAGIEENDIILEINGQKIDQNHSLAGLIRKYNPGDAITLKVLHDGNEKTIQATLTEYSE
ncbi:MAG: hypothetical protein COY66_04660 [Candidatus Kerfeldbacteria bacterium CG_4_10_14_0_8_um_filter_42_10]|uniref:PDZ domain-containing protein n=1 Tax=Candidatus Kerfeldbacteria bacterium CG_4_10_14_0_8_um_filter_42_10 TaxID=2014248 RepID=A0A2M7RHR9_9BACT|nr:MAG: hypothetical protein COY66_04660 [Candidatus Kerfeldbacteria bacterium CG_4_10_14_0_8_um_filter_42_10]